MACPNAIIRKNGVGSNVHEPGPESNVTLVIKATAATC